MCGRFTLRISPDVIAQMFDVSIGLDSVADFRPRYNVAPTTPVLCIREPAPPSSVSASSTTANTPAASTEASAGQRELFLARWGLVPSWAKDRTIAASCINARSDTVDKRPAFRAAFKKRRCVVVAEGFFEWRRGDKQPFYISLRSGRPMPFAGLWEWWPGDGTDGPFESCTICTTDGNAFMGELHDRMPVILPEDAIGHWLARNVVDPTEVKPMLSQLPGELMQAWPVDRRVGNVRNEGPELIEPVQSSAEDQPSV